MAKLKLETTVRFRKEAKRCKKRGLPMNLLWDIVERLLNGEVLDEKFHTHLLGGQYKDCWECHILPDWLLIWQYTNDKLTLLLTNTGTHSDLFGKHKR